MLTRFFATIALGLFAVIPAAVAGPNLSVDFDAPLTYVYDSGVYEVTVSNTGNRTAKNVVVEIALPETNTSPTVHLMGELDSYSSRCDLVDHTLVCDLGRIRKNNSKTIDFEMMVPVNMAQTTFGLVASASNASTVSSTEPANLKAYDTPITVMRPAHVRHCTGQGLSAFYECVLYPSSISSHDIVLNDDNTITIVGQPDYSGTWAQSSDHVLTMTYTQNNMPVIDFAGIGAGGGCFEGLTLFFGPSSAWSAPYEVCLQ